MTELLICRKGDIMKGKMWKKRRREAEETISEKWRKKLPGQYREYTISQMKAECDEFYRQVDELIANESSLEEMECFMEKNEDLITAGQVFTAWSKEQMWKMLDAKKD